jgi:hypothetical protein
MDLPPADAHNSADDIANTPTPVPPKKTGGAVKNRKRSLSYKPRKGTNNQKRSASLHPPNPSASTAAPSDASQQQDIAALATDSPEFKLTTKKEILKLLRQSQKDLAEAQNAAEHSEALKLAKESEEKERRTETTAKNRLNDLKNMRDQNSQLKSIIEEDRETMQATILELMEDNFNMQEKLHIKKEELALAEHDLNEACEEIHVSTLRGIA